MSATLCTRFATQCRVPASHSQRNASVSLTALSPVRQLGSAQSLRSLHQQRSSLSLVNRRITASAAAAETVESSPSESTSNKYAIVEIGGTQMLVEEGRWYSCNRLQAEPGSKVQLGRVIAHRDGGNFTIGKPYLEGVKVEAEILEEFKGPKVLVYKMKPKKHYRRMRGHRQNLTKFKVTKISA
uniref:Large subunit ribosomal protein L21 n=1 Tax=Tetraselmis sp. GSL018 TaxID=582737 RepID=A0A061S9D8_9CHLO|mmetsp:Transcript_15988/g.37904  ORF Transcript_15988/g.37904 Transcript_15988/m.37904 type:complete len:184 (+) Transcript_15988:96-647(+)